MTVAQGFRPGCLSFIPCGLSSPSGGHSSRLAGLLQEKIGISGFQESKGKSWKCCPRPQLIIQCYLFPILLAQILAHFIFQILCHGAIFIPILEMRKLGCSGRTWIGIQAQVCLTPTPVNFFRCHEAISKCVPYLMCVQHDFVTSPCCSLCWNPPPAPSLFLVLFIPPLHVPWENHIHKSSWKLWFPQAELGDPLQ